MVKRCPNVRSVPAIRYSIALLLSLAFLCGAGLAHAPQVPSRSQTSPTAPPNSNQGDRAVLLQLNSALEGLAAKVSPAVVQILVTGFGPLKESADRSQAAFIVRQHAVGSGVIVDSAGTS